MVIDDYMVMYTDGFGEAEFSNNSWTVTDDRLIFLLRGCEEAMVSLSHSPTVTTINAYIIYIGVDANMKTKLVKRGSTGVEDLEMVYDSEDILSCTEERSFWIHWGGMYVEFGKGDEPGLHPVGTLYDQNLMDINGLSIASGTDQRMRWQFPKSFGNNPIYFSIIKCKIYSCNVTVQFHQTCVTIPVTFM